MKKIMRQIVAFILLFSTIIPMASPLLNVSAATGSDISKLNIANFKKQKEDIYTNSDEYILSGGDPYLVSSPKEVSKELSEVLESNMDNNVLYNIDNEAINKEAYKEVNENIFNSDVINELYSLDNKEREVLSRYSENELFEYHLVRHGKEGYILQGFKMKKADNDKIVFSSIKDNNLIVKKIIVNNEVYPASEELELDIKDIKGPTDVRFIYDQKKSEIPDAKLSLNNKDGLVRKDIELKEESNTANFKILDSIQTQIEFPTETNSLDVLKDEKSFDLFVKKLIKEEIHSKDNTNKLIRELNFKAGDHNKINVKVDGKKYDTLFINNKRFIIINPKDNNIIGHADIDKVIYKDNLLDSFSRKAAVEDAFLKKLQTENKNNKPSMSYNKQEMFGYPKDINVLQNIPSLEDSYIYDVKLFDNKDGINKISLEYSKDMFNVKNKNLNIKDDKLEKSIEYNISNSAISKLMAVKPNDSIVNHSISNRAAAEESIMGSSVISMRSARALKRDTSEDLLKITYRAKDFNSGYDRFVAEKLVSQDKGDFRYMMGTVGTAIKNFEERGFQFKSFELLDESGKDITSSMNNDTLKKKGLDELKGHDLKLFFDLNPFNGFTKIYHIYQPGSATHLLYQETEFNNSVKIKNILNKNTHHIDKLIINGVYHDYTEGMDVASLLTNKSNNILVNYKANDDVCKSPASWEAETSDKAYYGSNAIHSRNYQNTSIRTPDALTKFTVKYQADKRTNSPLRFNFSVNATNRTGATPTFLKSMDDLKPFIELYGKSGYIRTDMVQIGAETFYLSDREDGTNQMDLINLDSRKIEGYAIATLNTDKATSYNEYSNKPFDERFDDFTEDKKGQKAQNVYMIDVVYWNPNNMYTDELKTSFYGLTQSLSLPARPPQGDLGEPAEPAYFIGNTYGDSHFTELVPCGAPMSSDYSGNVFSVPGPPGMPGKSLPKVVFEHYIKNDDGSTELIRTEERPEHKFFSLTGEESVRESIGVVKGSNYFSLDKILKEYNGEEIFLNNYTSSIQEYYDALDLTKFEHTLMYRDDPNVDLTKPITIVDKDDDQFMYVTHPSRKRFLKNPDELDKWGEYFTSKETTTIKLFYEKKSTIPETTDLKIIKKDAVNGRFLSGAEFELINKETKEVVQTGITNIDGLIELKDLDNTIEYILRETKAPNKYRIHNEDIQVSFSETDIENGVKEIEVLNYKAAEAPETGTLGKLPFIFSSLLFVLIAYAAKRKIK